MQTISYARHRFRPDVIRDTVGLYCASTLSYRDVEDLLRSGGWRSGNETIRRMVLKFGPVVARNLRRRRPVRQGQWHIANNRAENSHPASAAKRAQDAGLKSAAAARRFVAVYAAVT
ncbi:MAG: family transposase, partial [Rhodospirillales bacterium]|nr:family transposase [Rhodospirillales bacterium]